jgi:hypothetical protein
LEIANEVGTDPVYKVILNTYGENSGRSFSVLPRSRSPPRDPELALMASEQYFSILSN